jgi:hypothetical protein
MMWRNRLEVVFAKHDGRERGGVDRVETGLYCQRYGKSLSVEHWEETVIITCDTFRSILWTKKNGTTARVEQSIHNPTSCGRVRMG